MKYLDGRRHSVGTDIECISVVKKILQKEGEVSITSLKYTKPPLLCRILPGMDGEPTDIDNANVFIITLDNAPVIELSHVLMRSGKLFPENLSEPLEKRVEETLAKYGFQTGNMAWEYTPERPIIFLILFWILLFAGIFTVIEMVSNPVFVYSGQQVYIWLATIFFVVTGGLVFFYRRTY
ncbi:MAG: hypothetical protein PVF58_04910 [Candidatus Methanofastidiosia archaeon]